MRSGTEKAASGYQIIATIDYSKVKYIIEQNDRPPLRYHASRFAALIPLPEEAPALPEFW